VATISPLDATAANINNTGTTAANGVTSTGATPSIAGELIFGATMDDAGTATIIAGTGFTRRQNTGQMATEDRIQAIPASAAATFTFNRAHSYLAQMVTFRPQVVDTIPPTVDITAPLNASIAAGSNVTVSATANDDAGIAGVQFLLDGVNLGSEDTASPYTRSWDSMTVANGPHTISARARDLGGNFATSPPIGVTVSNPPSLVIDSPVQGALLVLTTTVQVTYHEVGDLAGFAVNHVHFVLDGASEVMDITMDGTYTFTNVSAGPHLLQGFLVTASHTKIAGTDAVPVSFTTSLSDIIPPSVTMTAPANGTTVTGVVNPAANAVDNLAVAGVQFVLDGNPLGAEVLTPPFTTPWNTSASTNGSHTLWGVARDAAGNLTTSSQLTVTVANIAGTDPATVGEWGAVMNWPLIAIHATLLNNGMVLMWDDHTTDGGAYLYNPQSGAFLSIPYSSVNLFCAGTVAEPDGTTLVVGGHTATYFGVPDTTEFSPAQGTWRPRAAMAFPRWYPTATVLPDGRILTTSGADYCPTCDQENGSRAGMVLIPEVFDPVTNVWTKLANASLYVPMYPHMFVLPDGRVFAASSQEEPMKSVVLDINSQSWTVVDNRTLDGGSAAMYLPGKIMKSGTARNPDFASGPSSATTYVIDMNLPNPTWRDVATMAFPRTQHNTTILPDGTLLVTGGSRDSNVFNDAPAVMEAEMWSPVTEAWTTLAPMQVARKYHSTSLLLPDGRVLVAGGGRFGTDHPDAQIYSPPYLFKGARPTITSAPSLVQYGSPFQVTTPNAAQVARVSLVKLGSVTHAFDSDQRFIPLSFQQGAGTLTVTSPVGPTAAPPGYYMLFIVDTNGVPSVASMVQLPLVADLTAPSAPTGLNGNGGTGTAGLSWTASTDNVAVTTYNIHRSTSPGFVPTTANRVGTTSATSFVNSGLSPGLYAYLVTAEDAAGNVSSASNEVSAAVLGDTQAPSVPSGLTLSFATAASIAFSWSPSSDNSGIVSQYTIFRNGVQAGTAAGPSYADSGLSPATSYSYTVTASDPAGNVSAPSAPLNATTSAFVSGLVAAYSFNEGSGTVVHDGSGSGNDGTISGATWNAAGKFGAALAFSGSGQATVPHTASLNLSSSFTLSAWVKPTSLSGYQTILIKESTAGCSYWLQTVGNQISGGFNNGAGCSEHATTTANIPVGTWSHIVVVFDDVGNTFRLYLNGVLISSQTETGTVSTNTQALVLGQTVWGERWLGLIDEVRIYNRALSQAEVQLEMVEPL
jgi:chitodextrinase